MPSTACVYMLQVQPDAVSVPSVGVWPGGHGRACVLAGGGSWFRWWGVR